jgi:hypothetical protein
MRIFIGILVGVAFSLLFYFLFLRDACVSHSPPKPSAAVTAKNTAAQTAAQTATERCPTQTQQQSNNNNAADTTKQVNGNARHSDQTRHSDQIRKKVVHKKKHVCCPYDLTKGKLVPSDP